MTENSELKNTIIKIIARFSLLSLFIILITFLPAGTFNYWQAHLYIAIVLLTMLFNLLYLIKNDPQLLARRTKVVEKEKVQLVIQLIFFLFFLSGFIISGIDKRFGWSHVPYLLVIAADLIIILGNTIVFFVFKQNSYASRIIEVHNNQTVISTGLYSIVRHPMYIGVILMFVPIPIALGSYLGLLIMFTIPLGLILRIIHEETFLKRELPGYKEYCLKTKYRLLPFVW